MLFQGSLLEGFPIEINQFIVPVPQAELCGGLTVWRPFLDSIRSMSAVFPGSGEA